MKDLPLGRVRSHRSGSDAEVAGSQVEERVGTAAAGAAVETAAAVSSASLSSERRTPSSRSSTPTRWTPHPTQHDAHAPCAQLGEDPSWT